MRIAVIAPSALPSRRANAIQTVQMAQAFARLGHEVLLIAYPSPPAPLPEGEGKMLSPPAPLPEGEGRMPSPRVTLPEGEGRMPSPPAPLPEGEGRKPSPPAPLPEGEGRMPSPLAPLPEEEGKMPSPPAPLPEGEGRKPSPRVTLPEGEGRMPSPPAPLHEGEGGKPSPAALLPEGEGRSPHLQPLSQGKGGADWEALAAEYGLETRFEVHWIKARIWARRYDFSLQAIWAAQRWGAECLFTRLPQAAAGASLCGIPTIFEAHDLPRSGAAWLFRLFLLGRGAKRVVAISNALAADLMEAFPSLRRFREAFLVVAPDGVDLRRYTPLLSPAEARQRLWEKGWELPDGFIAGYTGHLYSGRGAELLVALAVTVPEAHFLIVGGEAEPCQQLEAQFKTHGLTNYTLTGMVAPQQVPLFQMASDVLLMPYQARVAASSGGDIARYLSPMKLFEYLASARPILASDLPVFREVLNAENAILLPLNDIQAWADALRLLREDVERYRGLAEAAQRTAEKYRWESRAERILMD